jgi:hypothetical protein
MRKKGERERERGRAKDEEGEGECKEIERGKTLTFMITALSAAESRSE